MKIQESLGYKLNTSARLISRKLDMELKKYNITTAQWAVLKLLSVESSLSQAEIAEKINIDRASCGAIIEKLILKGLLEKELCKNDRRSYKVKILPLTLNIVAEISLIVEKVNTSAIDAIDKSEFDILTKCLDTLILNLGGKI